MQLNTNNIIKATGELAVPVLRYRFYKINWRLKEIQKIDTKPLKIPTMYKMHHPEVAIDTQCVKGKEGRRGLLCITGTQNRDKKYCRISEHTVKQDQSGSIIKFQERN